MSKFYYIINTTINIIEKQKTDTKKQLQQYKWNCNKNVYTTIVSSFMFISIEVQI